MQLDDYSLSSSNKVVAVQILYSVAFRTLSAHNGSRVQQFYCTSTCLCSCTKSLLFGVSACRVAVALEESIQAVISWLDDGNDPKDE
eukprot:2283194-Amphidinium_carterae.1